MFLNVDEALKLKGNDLKNFLYNASYSKYISKARKLGIILYNNITL